MKKTLIALGLVVAMLLGITYVYAGGPGFGPGHGPGTCAGAWGASNLTPEQETKLQELRQNHYNEVAPFRNKMFSLRQEIRTLWSDPTADPKVIQGKTTEMRDLRDQMQDKMVQLRLDARALLTPDQIQASGADCGQGCGPGGGAGPGHGPGRGRGRF
jgi:periplasmic protein CpxP/Spy